MLPEKGYKRVFVICFYIALAVVAFYFFFNYVLKWTWPILIALVVGVCLQPLIRFLNRKLKFPNKLAAILCVILFYLIVGGLLAAVIYKLVAELSVLAASIPSYVQKLNIDLESIEDSFKSMLKWVPVSGDVLDKAWQEVTNSLVSVLLSFAGKMTSNLPSMLFAMAQFVPEAILAIIITIVTSVYFAADYNKIRAFFICQISEKRFEKLVSAKNHILQTILKYIRAYLLLMLITGVEIYLGLTLIGQKYALLLAIAIAIIDILPVLGTGTVLIPWGVVLLIMGNTLKGVLILALYIVVTVIRQIIEPKIVGEYIGLYPLITLVAMYTGLRAMGLFGMILFPVTIIILKDLNEKNSIHFWNNMPASEKAEKEPIKAKLFKKIKKDKSNEG